MELVNVMWGSPSTFSENGTKPVVEYNRGSVGGVRVVS